MISMGKILPYLAGASVILGAAALGKEIADAYVVAAGAEPSYVLDMIQYLPSWAKAVAATGLAAASGANGYAFDRILNKDEK